MNKNHQEISAIILLLLILSLSCNLTSTSDVNIPPETLAAMTWAAIETDATSATSTNTITPSYTPLKITNTSTITYTPITPITARPTSTPNPTFTPTSIFPTITNPGGGGGGGGGYTVVPPPCNAAAFIEHVSIPNGTILPPSINFTKVWKIKNVGSCVWTKNYKFIFYDGEKFSSSNIFLSKKVYPGENIDIEIDMTSPSSDGDYTGYWYIEDEVGYIFGYGNQHDNPFIVDISVEANTRGVIANLQNGYCSAEWTGDNKSLPCPGIVGSKYGFVVKYKQPILENGKVSDSALWTHPPLNKGSTIKGKFPAIYIQSGDQFHAEIGCLNGYPKCDVTFKLYFKEGDQEKQLIGQWHQILDGSPQKLDIDLSSLGEKFISFTLAVIGNGNPEQNAAYWYHPEIYRP